MGEAEYMVRASGYLGTLADFRSIPLRAEAGGVPVTLGDVANVQIGPELRRGIGSILKEMPPLGWIWLEGGGDVAEVWRKHAERRKIEYHQVQAEDWRPTVMLPRQQRSGEQAKREADAIARGIIEWSGAPRPKGELRHDAAEAILLGVHGSIQSGLLEQMPKL